MPAFYTHLRFGTRLLQDSAKDAMRPVRHFRRMFEAGLQGPDFFFYHSPLFPTEVDALGKTFHRQTGREFFTRVCAMLKNDPSEAGLAYLYGILAHYCLDAHCHPYVHEATADKSVGHTELEVEFDRYLLSLDGKVPAHTQDLSSHMKLTRGESVTVSQFYPGSSAGNVHSSVKNMTRCMRFLAGKNRKFLSAVMKHTPGTVPQHLMPEHANHKCLHRNKDLLALYEQALDAYPVMLRQLLSHMETGAELGSEFDRTFG